MGAGLDEIIFRFSQAGTASRIGKLASWRSCYPRSSAVADRGGRPGAPTLAEIENTQLIDFEMP